MVTSFEYKGYKYTRVPKEEIPTYTDGDNNIFIIGDVLSETKMQYLIDTNTKEFIEHGVLLENSFEKQNLETEIDMYVDYYDRVWSYNIKDFFCFVGKKYN